MSFGNKLHVCTVNPLTCRTGTRTKKTSSTKETKGKAITTERTGGKKGKSGKLCGVQVSTGISMQTLMTIRLSPIKGLPHDVLMVGVFWKQATC